MENDIRIPDWAEIKRILKNPQERFVCIEQDLETPEGTKRHQASFRAQEEVYKVLKSEIAGEVYIRVCRAGVPKKAIELILERPSGVIPGHLADFLFDLMRRVSYLILLEAVRAYGAERRQLRRDAARQIPLDATTGEGEVPLHEVIADQRAWTKPTTDLESLFDVLTEREGQVIVLLAQGYAQGEIADILEISPGRVSQIMRQVQIKCKIEP
nr:hypothetical protein [Chloroflexota bacterium]